jgi:hypothetical protein
MRRTTPPKRTLPIFRAIPKAFDGAPNRLLNTLFGGASVTAIDHASRVDFIAESKQLELDKGTSALWFADTTQLWKPPALDASAPPAVSGRATSVADGIAELFASPWERVSGVTIRREPLPEQSTLATMGTDSPIAIDQYASSRFVMTVPNPWHDGDLDIPIAGRTAKMALTLNPAGDPIGLQYSWWDLEYVDDRPLIPATANLGALTPQSPDLLIDGFSASLVYHEVAVADREWLLVPMWMITPTAIVAGRKVRLMTSLKPASDVPEPPPRAEPEQTRDPTRPMAPAAPPPSVYRFGMSWMGSLHGLGRTYESIARVQEVLQRHRWRKGFDWGNRLATEEDWHVKNDEWVDAVDLAYFCGHAAFDGWTFADFRLTHDDLAATYGNGRLRWVVLDACGPLQDPSTGASVPNDARERWRGMFDGLRILMGGAASLSVNDFVGERFAELAVDRPLIDAWFQANRELRPNEIDYEGRKERVWVGALFATSSDGDAREDRLPLPGNGQPVLARLVPDSVRAELIPL